MNELRKNKKNDKNKKYNSLTPSEKLSYNFLTDKEDDILIEETQIDYDGLINLDKKDFSLNAKPDFIPKENDEDIAFYCKHCKKITDILDIDEVNNSTDIPDIKFKKNKNDISLICEVCNKKEIIIGTTRGLNEHFHLT